MATRMQPAPRQRLQGIRHISQRNPRPGLHEGPLLRLRVLQHDPPLVREQDGQGPAVCVRGVRMVGAPRLGGCVDQVECRVAGLGGAMGRLEAFRTLEAQGVGEAGEHFHVDGVAQRGEFGELRRGVAESWRVFDAVGEDLVARHLIHSR